MAYSHHKVSRTKPFQAMYSTCFHVLLVAFHAMLTTDPLNSGLTQLTRFGAGNACDTPCAGDARITCGGQQQASVYLENDATPAVPPNEYTPVGCYK